MRKSLVENSIYSVIYKLVATLYPLIAVTYVSHILQSEKMGMVSYAQNIVSYFAVIAALGLPSYGIRETAKKANNVKERSKLFFELFSINAISTTISLALYAILVYIIPRFSDNKPLYIVAGLQILLNYINVDWFFQGLEEYRYISIRSIIIKIIAIILLLVLIHTPDDYIYYALIYCLAIAGNNIFNIVKLKSYICHPHEKKEIKQHLKPIFILLAASMAIEIYAMIDTTMLGVFCNDTVVGCYSNAMKLTRMVTTTAAAAGSVLLPRLSKIFTANDKNKFNELVNSGIKIMLVFAVPSMTGVLLLSREIIYVFFGYSFAQAIPILRILALMIPVVVCNTIMGGQVLVTSNMEYKYVFSVMIASIVNVILNSIFIPRYGASSAAVASLISEIIDLVLYIWFARKIVQIKLSLHFIFSTAIPISIYTVVSALGLSRLPINNVIGIIINIIVCITIYFGLGLIMKNEAMLLTLTKALNLVKHKR